MPFRAQIDDQSGLQYGNWKDDWNAVLVPEGMYEINHEGLLRNKQTKNILKPNKKQQVTLYDGNGGKQMRYVYQLALETFFPHIPRNGRTADHIDENYKNNHISNLQWLTQAQQMTKSNQLQPRGKKSGATLSKPVEQWKDNIKIAIYASTHEAESKTGILNGSISACARGEQGRPTAGGYEWKYIELESQKDLEDEEWGTNPRLVEALQERGTNKMTSKSARKVEISNLGRRKDAKGRISKGKKQDRGGYYRKYAGWYMHQLVWMVWGDGHPVPREGDKLKILHNDEIEKDDEGCVDNGIDNLRLDTQSENIYSYYRAKAKKRTFDAASSEN